MAVVFAMLASYLLSRTLVPTMVAVPAAPATPRSTSKGEDARASEARLVWRVHARFNAGFERLREGYRGAAGAGAGAPRAGCVAVFLVFCVGSLPLAPCVGRDFFPSVDAGQIRLHVRAPAGTRIEETARIFGRVEDAIRAMIPARELANILDNIGLPLQRHQPRLQRHRHRSAPATARSWSRSAKAARSDRRVRSRELRREAAASGSRA